MEELDEHFSRLRKESDSLRREAKKRVMTYMGAAFGLIAGLAWNEAIKGLIEYLFPLDKNSLLAKFIYAVLVTIVVVIVSVYLVRLFKEEKQAPPAA